MQRPGPERHALDRAGRQRAERTAAIVLVAERALDHVGQPLDIAMRVEGPDRAWDQAVVVEDAQRTEAVVLGVAVLVEGEVPASVKPAALDVIDLTITADLHHGVL